MEYLITISVLSILLITTNLFWALQSQRLVNKLMSRDFAEYKSSESYKPTKIAERNVVAGPDEDLSPLHEVIF